MDTLFKKALFFGLTSGVLLSLPSLFTPSTCCVFGPCSYTPESALGPILTPIIYLLGIGIGIQATIYLKKSNEAYDKLKNLDFFDQNNKKKDKSNHSESEINS